MHKLIFLATFLFTASVLAQDSQNVCATYKDKAEQNACFNIWQDGGGMNGLMTTKQNFINTHTISTDQIPFTDITPITGTNTSKNTWQKYSPRQQQQLPVRTSIPSGAATMPTSVQPVTNASVGTDSVSSMAASSPAPMTNTDVVGTTQVSPTTSTVTGAATNDAGGDNSRQNIFNN